MGGKEMGFKKTIASSTAIAMMAAMGLTQSAFAATTTTTATVPNFTFTNISLLSTSTTPIPNVISVPYALVSVTVTQTAPDYIGSATNPQAEDQHMLPAVMSFTFMSGGQMDTVTGVMASSNVSSLQPQVPYITAGSPPLTWTTTYAVPLPSTSIHGGYRIVVGESGAPVTTMDHYTSNSFGYYSGTTLMVNQWTDTDDPIAGTVMTSFCHLPSTPSTTPGTTSPDRDNPGVGNQGEPGDKGDNGNGNNGDPGYGKGNQKKGFGQWGDQNTSPGNSNPGSNGNLGHQNGNSGSDQGNHNQGSGTSGETIGSLLGGQGNQNGNSGNDQGNQGNQGNQGDH